MAKQIRNAKADTTSELSKIRHSASHVLAEAVLRLYPDAKPALGPPIEEGFYYDFDFPASITETDLQKIEKEMTKILKEGRTFEMRELPAAETKAWVAANPYKAEILNTEVKGSAKPTKDDAVSFCFSESVDKSKDSFKDMCRGGHVHGSNEIGAVKLLKLAGAYWRGDEKNKMLTRIYGTAFATQAELDEYLVMLEEAKKRDHKVLGPKLDLFMFHETSPGMPYWLPHGVVVYNELVNFWRLEHQERDYQEIVSPLLNKKELYITSGHYEHYWADMFVAKTEEGEEYGVKAMNCPNAMVVFGSKARSYRELPLRLSDTDTLHRNELSGTLNGLLRVREFRQDDAHIFVTEEQIESEYQNVLDIVERFYSIFNLEYSFRLGTRPESFMGDVKTWDKAESDLKKILEGSGKPFTIEEGDGAFYGPKIDILMKDALGRQWQMGTIQLDFQQPRRFELEYTAADGTKKTPVAIHRVVYGSLERFIGILIEHFAGAFPLWLAPVQAKILTIASEYSDYAAKVAAELKATGLRVEIDDRNESIGKKIREAEMMKIPYMLIIGAKEAEAGWVAVRSRTKDDLGAMETAKFISLAHDEITAKR